MNHKKKQEKHILMFIFQEPKTKKVKKTETEETTNESKKTKKSVRDFNN